MGFRVRAKATVRARVRVKVGVPVRNALRCGRGECSVDGGEGRGRERGAQCAQLRGERRANTARDRAGVAVAVAHAGVEAEALIGGWGWG